MVKESGNDGRDLVNVGGRKVRRVRFDLISAIADAKLIVISNSIEAIGVLEGIPRVYHGQTAVVMDLNGDYHKGKICNSKSSRGLVLRFFGNPDNTIQFDYLSLQQVVVLRNGTY
ncbi:MAG: hypothetical protein ABIH37_01060 [archaeon]